MKSGTELITEERKRQIEKHGWDEYHDSSHTDMALATAGASYALGVVSKHGDVSKGWRNIYSAYSKRIWPFNKGWFKPTPNDPVKQLVKAGALIAAEIDRLQAL